jgi:hypothetical protein
VANSEEVNTLIIDWRVFSPASPLEADEMMRKLPEVDVEQASFIHGTAQVLLPSLIK